MFSSDFWKYFLSFFITLKQQQQHTKHCFFYGTESWSVAFTYFHTNLWRDNFLPFLKEEDREIKQVKQNKKMISILHNILNLIGNL